MKQYEAVIYALEALGGQATLAELYLETMKIKQCTWGTKTPFASIRRIVQTRPEIFKVRPGLWALVSYKSRLGLAEPDHDPNREADRSHSYYQGMLVIIGNLRGFSTFVPNQDKNKKFVQKNLGELRTLAEMPHFSHDSLMRRSGTVDVTWFNDRQMPHSFFEVEHSTDIQNSLLKFFELQDFHARMVIVSHDSRKHEFHSKLNLSAFGDIRERVGFLEYDMLVKQYEYEVMKAGQTFVA